VHRLGNALHSLRTEIGQVEEVAQQASGALGDHDLAGLRQPLKPCREVGRLADHRLLLCSAFADQIADDHESGRDPDPSRQQLARRRLQSADRLGERQSRPHRPFRLVFVCARPAKIGQHAIAHELGDVTFQTSDLTGHRVLVGPDHLAHVLGIELRRQRRRAHQVAEQHRQLPPLRFHRPSFGCDLG
jgi:hypothetical protein